MTSYGASSMTSYGTSITTINGASLMTSYCAKLGPPHFSMNLSVTKEIYRYYSVLINSKHCPSITIHFIE